MPRTRYDHWLKKWRGRNDFGQHAGGRASDICLCPHAYQGRCTSTILSEGTGDWLVLLSYSSIPHSPEKIVRSLSNYSAPVIYV